MGAGETLGPYMGHSQLLRRVLFRLETIRRDVACALLRKSAGGVNTSEERCDSHLAGESGVH